MDEGVYIGPIKHSTGQCQKTDCVCWCQACARHNWRHEKMRDLVVAARDAVEAAGTQRWPVNCDRLRMALDGLGELE